MRIEPTPITLTEHEAMMGAYGGAMVNIDSIFKDRKPSAGYNKDFAWNDNIEGACGEIAAAKALGRFWAPKVGGFAAPDIGMHIQVRTRLNHAWDLLVRPEDREKFPRDAFILVTGKTPNFNVWGYRLLPDCIRDEWIKDYGGRPDAWFVPQQSLWPLSDLILIPQVIA